MIKNQKYIKIQPEHPEYNKVFGDCIINDIRDFKIIEDFIHDINLLCKNWKTGRFITIIHGLRSELPFSLSTQAACFSEIADHKNVC